MSCRDSIYREMVYALRCASKSHKGTPMEDRQLFGLIQRAEKALEPTGRSLADLLTTDQPPALESGVPARKPQHVIDKDNREQAALRAINELRRSFLDTTRTTVERCSVFGFACRSCGGLSRGREVCLWERCPNHHRLDRRAVPWLEMGVLRTTGWTQINDPEGGGFLLPPGILLSTVEAIKERIPSLRNKRRYSVKDAIIYGARIDGWKVASLKAAAADLARSHHNSCICEPCVEAKEADQS